MHFEFGGRFVAGFGTRILCDQQINFGNNVKLGWEVQIIDSDCHNIIREGYQKTSSVFIENDVWIANRASVFKGVTIGEGSVVAAGTIVTKDVPAHSLVGGVPGKVIKSDIKWSK